GNVFHDVKLGQTLWQIAVTYNVKIDDIKRLNNLFNNNIYPGSSLLIRQGLLMQAVSPTEALTQAVASASLPTLTQAAHEATVTSTPGAITQPTARNNTAFMNAMIAIVVLALLGGAIFTLAGSSKK
ncbi:MAG TPA: LysM peptidoglycan-binding domain-containing protein, partial [Anaerolineales bacterium]|nr:LysM peptidoglycan-binding domain-containing protein [Anaerolineales bacterium]